MEYTFIYKNDGWWLKINTPDQLFNYHEKIDSKWSKEFYNLVTSKEFGCGMNHATRIAYAIGQHGANRGMNLIQATQDFRAIIIKNQLDALLEYGEIYINQNGGYHFKNESDIPYSQFCHKKELIFPDFKTNEIRVSKFPGGEHFYAYIGDMQVRDGDILKWDTYEEAYNKALKLASDKEEEKEL